MWLDQTLLSLTDDLWLTDKIALPYSYDLIAVFSWQATMAEGKHLFPFRTEQLSPPAPMVLPPGGGGRVGRRRGFMNDRCPH